MLSPVSGIPSMPSLMALAGAQQAIAQATTRLATGQRINSAADDPAGLIAALEMASREAELTARIDSYQREDAALSAADGAMSEISSMLGELDGLAVAAANTAGLSDAEREALQVEADSLVRAIDHVASTSTFAGEPLLADAASGLASAADLSQIATGGSASLSGAGAQDVVRAAIANWSSQRAEIGLRLNENHAMASALTTEYQNTAAARSLIADADYAAETSNLVREQILEQASLLALAASGAQPRAGLSLLA